MQESEINVICRICRMCRICKERQL